MVPSFMISSMTSSEYIWSGELYCFCAILYHAGQFQALSKNNSSQKNIETKNISFLHLACITINLSHMPLNEYLAILFEKSGLSFLGFPTVEKTPEPPLTP